MNTRDIMGKKLNEQKFIILDYLVLLWKRKRNFCLKLLLPPQKTKIVCYN